ncbi:hypothetical protein [Streptomyces erythrochromogenes]|uniref:hypothetical protein n=1 Tax=Streptomyces erythrochromogenes TaxID=285574 RepID=UPI00386698C9|nr:hypothetical protein OG364_27785 [Streptomyces erythrochromogenes]
MSGFAEAAETVLRYRRPDPAGTAVARHTDRIAVDLRRQQRPFGTAVGHGVAVRALALGV